MAEIKKINTDLQIEARLLDGNGSAGTSGQILSSTGTATDWISLSEISGVDGTGTANYVAKWSDADTITNSVIYDDGTNVGIGTTSPAHKLHVVGANNDPIIRAVRGNNTAQYLDIRGYQVLSQGNNMLISTEDGREIWLGQESNLQRMIINSSGNVGIGTTSPGTKLHVGSGSGATVDTGYQMVIDSAGIAGLQILSATTQSGRIVFGDSGDNDIGMIKYDHTDNSMGFRTNGSGNERMRITSAGNVGIGTTSPNQKLTIDGTDQYVATQQTSYPWGGSVTLGLRMGTDATAGVLDFRRWTGSATLHGTALITQVNSDGGYGLDFRVDNKSTNTSATTSRMFLSTSGEVGIGTISPSSKTHIFNSSVQDGLFVENSSSSFVGSAIFGNNTSTTNGNLLRLRSSGSDKMVVLGNGNAGIGITAPVSKLHVYNNDGQTSTAAGITVEQDGTGDAIVQYLLTAVKRWTTGVDNSDGDKFKISQNADLATDNVMTLTTAGNVGIGTTSPSIKLDVVDAGASRTWSHYFATVAAFERNGDSIVNIVSGNTGNASLWFGRSNSMVRGRIRYEQGNDKMELWTANAPKAYIDSSGNLHATADVVAYSSSVSDIRLKDNINTIDSALNKVKKLRGVEYTWNAGSRKDKKDLGVIAQEVEEVLPEIVHEHKMDLIDEQVYKTVDYEKITAVLIEAVKEQQKQIDELKNQLDAFTK